MLQKPGIYLLLAVLLFTFISINLTSPPAVVSDTAPDSVFSAKRAYRFLVQIANKPHSSGTSENKMVRDYIVTTCTQFGLITQIQNTTAVRRKGSRVEAANVSNVIARLKGNHRGKCVLIMAHYDSQPNTPGAGDDGAAVAAMLETAQILTSAKTTFQNDIVFLFTDSEESELHGAQGFLQDSTLAKEVGIVLNFEGRGNRGISTMFEVNPRNGWIVDNYIKSASYPNANSLSYEIYKMLPNDTDYSLFKEMGISGLNNAFIEGFVNYHSPTDTPENLDLRSLQHHGSNMLSLAKHFGNISLTETKSPDISYFNMIGNWIASYPASWNFMLVVLCNVTFVFFLIMGFRKKRIAFNGFGIGFISFIVVLTVLFFASVYLIKGLNAFYPLNSRFYASNTYNTHYHFLAITAFAIFIFSFVSQWPLSKFNTSSLLAGILLVESILLDLLYMAMPTAIYLLFVPLFFLLLAYIFIFSQNIWEAKNPWPFSIIILISIVPAIVIFSPTIKLVYVAFGLTYQTAGVVILLGIFLGLLLPVFRLVFAGNRYVIPGAALLCFIVAIVLAQLDSAFTPQHPLQSNVRYLLDDNEKKASWISDFNSIDDWNKQFFKNPATGNAMGLSSEAPLLPLLPPLVAVKKDTLEDNVRKLYLHCRSAREAISMWIFIDNKNPAMSIKINNQEETRMHVESSQMDTKYTRVDFYGLTNDGFDVLFEVTPGIPFEITLIDRSMGLPEIMGYSHYPANIVPGVDWNSNTTQVKKRFVF